MTGGELFCRREHIEMLNKDYITPVELNSKDVDKLTQLISTHYEHTQCVTARELLESNDLAQSFVRCIPWSQVQRRGIDEPVLTITQELDGETDTKMKAG